MLTRLIDRFFSFNGNKNKNTRRFLPLDKNDNMVKVLKIYFNTNDMSYIVNNDDFPFITNLNDLEYSFSHLTFLEYCKKNHQGSFYINTPTELFRYYFSETNWDLDEILWFLDTKQDICNRFKLDDSIYDSIYDMVYFGDWLLCSKNTVIQNVKEDKIKNSRYLYMLPDDMYLLNCELCFKKKVNFGVA